MIDRIYKNLLAIRSPSKRTEMIQVILGSPEHAQKCKERGVYGHLVHYVQVVKGGGTPPQLPGETPQAQARPSQMQITTSNSIQKHPKPVSEKGNEKALNYFTACLRILELEEEVALTEQTLKSAYKKSIIRAHPDKPGGSEKEFEAVTRAYAYLGEILRRMQGAGTAGTKSTPKPSRGRGEHLEIEDRPVQRPQQQDPEPIRLNPDKMDMDAFNKMFEKTRIPDPEESGYGDWLKDASAGGPNSSGPIFSEKFNRDVFNKAFEEESKKNGGGGGGNVFTVQEQVLSNRLGYGTELGRSKRDDYTAANDEGLQYTDLKKAYTEYNMFSHEVANVQVENRSFDQMVSSRKEAPKALSQQEQEMVSRAARVAEQAEDERQKRMQEQADAEGDFYARMKRLVSVLPGAK